MLFVLICTEGEVSEPECIKAFLSTLKNQVPRSGEENVDVIPVPVNGNHGYKVLAERADAQITLVEADEDFLLHYADPGSTKEKWLVCDYDQLDDSGITYEEFKDIVTKAGFHLVMSKPNFEYYVLAVLAGWDVANSTHESNFVGEINKYVDRLNEANKEEKNFSAALMLPHYSKKLHVAEEFFGKLFHYNQELLLNLHETDNTSADRFSDMPLLVARLEELHSLD
jgi:hypothetical protein